MSQIGFTLSRTASKPGWLPGGVHDALWLQPLDGLLADVPFDLAAPLARFAASSGDARIGSVSFVAGGTVSGQPAVTLDWNQAGDAAVLALETAWNSIKNLAVTEFLGSALTVRNWVDVYVALAATGPLSVVAEAAKRGEILLSGAGPHTVVVGVESNVQDWTNHFRITTGDGADSVTIRQTALEAVRGIYLGQWTTTDIATGGGDDIVRGWGSNDTVDGGAGRDVFVLRGVEAGYSFTTVGDITTIRDINLADGNDGIDRVRNVEVIRFASGPDKLLGAPPANRPPVARDDSYTLQEDGQREADAFAGVLANDSDPDGDALSVLSHSYSGSGFLSVSADGGFVYRPAENFFGTESFTYTVRDAAGATATATVQLVVQPVNDAIVAAADTATTNEDTAVLIDVLANDSDVDGPVKAIDSVGAAAHGTVVIEAGQLRYTPNANFNGTDSFTYVATDTAGGTSTATVTVNVAGVNDAPVAVAESFTAGAGGTITANLLANDSDPNDAPANLPLTAQILTAGFNAGLFTSISLNSDTGAIELIAGNSAGSTSVHYRAVDALGAQSDLVTVTFTITPPGNTAPDAADGSATTAEDTQLAFALAPLVTDAENNVASFALGAVTGGTVTGFDTTTGTGIFTPNADFVGFAGIAFTVTDLGGLSDSASLAITVTPADDAPVAIDGSITTAEDTVASGQLGGVDNDTATLVFSLVGPAPLGLVLDPDGSFTFTPAADFSGAISFDFQVSDSTSSDTGTQTITVTPLNDAPVAIDGATTGAEDTVIAGRLAATDIDSANLVFGFAPGGVQAGGPLQLNADGSFVFTAPANFNGTYTINFQVSDGQFSDTGTHVITVTPVNDAPVASGGAFSVQEGDVVGGNLSGFDVDGDALTYSLVGPAPAGVTVLANGQYTIDVAADFNGTIAIDFQVSDGIATDSATLSVTYLPVNDAPVAANDSFTTAFNTTLVIAGPGVLANDSDIDSPDLDALLVSGPANGQLVLDDATGAFAYTPNAGFSGTDTFTYRAGDGALASNLATVSITVEAGPPAALVLDASGRAFITGSGSTQSFLLVTTPEGLAPNFHPNTSLHQGILPIEPGSSIGVGISAASNLGGTPDRDGTYDAYIVDANTGQVRVVDPLPGDAPVRNSEIIGYTSEGEYVVQASGQQSIYVTFNQLFLYDATANTYTALPGGPGSTAMSRTRGTDYTPGIDTDDFIFDNRLAYETTGAAVAGDTDGRTDAYLFDLLTDSVIALDATPGGVQGNGTSRFSGQYGYAILNELGSPFTPDGEWVVFETNSTNLGLPTTIFAQPEVERDMLVARNMTTGQLVRIDSRADGAPAIDPGSEAAVLRGFTALSGNRILFQSDDYLVDGMSGTGLHLFIKDLDDGSIIMVDSLADGTPSINTGGGIELEPLDTPGANARPQDFGPITWQGQDYQLFQAESARLMGLPDSTPSFQVRDRIYVKNLDTGYVYDIGLDPGAAAPTTSDIGNDKQYVGDGWVLGSRSALLTHLASDAASRLPNINLMTREDGTVATGNALVDWLGGDLFRVTTSANLLLADTDGFRDLYLVEVDRATGDRTITLTGSASDGTPGLTDSFPDAYPTDIPNVILLQTEDALVADDTDGQRDVYLKNYVTGEVTLLDRDFNGASGNSQSAVYPVFLDDIIQVRLINGKLIFATSTALVAEDTDGLRDAYLVDPFGLAAPILLDAAADGTNGNGASGSTFDVIYLTPEWVRFASTSTNLVPGVGNGTDSFIYLKNLVTGVVVPAQTTEAGTPFSGAGSGSPFSSDGQIPGTLNGLRLFATNQKLAENDLNGLYDEYLLDPLGNIIPWTEGRLAEVTLSATYAGATGATFTWGDGASDTVGATGNTASAVHRYAAGTYTAQVSVAAPGGPVAGSIAVIAGGTGRDTLTDLAGNTVLAGGLGEDTYVFATGHGQDIIAGFGPGDVVALAAFGAGFDSFAEILAATTDTAAGARIDTGGGNSILIQGVAKADLVFTDFDAPRPNVAPLAVTDVYTVFGTSPLTVAAGSGFLGNDRDEWGGTLSVQSVQTPSVGTLVSQPNGAFTYTAPAGFFGTVEFGYVVTDGSLTSNGTVRMNVVRTQTLDAVNDSYSVTQGQTLVVNAANGILTNDTGAFGPVTVSDATRGSFTLPGKGVFEIAADGSFSFAADANFVGLVELIGVGMRDLETGREDNSGRLSITVLDDGIFP